MNVSKILLAHEGKLNREENRSVFEFTQQFQLSAHSDIVSIMVDATDSLDEVQFYNPDADNFAYTMAYAPNGVVFALAMGLSGLIYRLPTQAVSGALVKGGEIINEIEGNWVNFNPFWPEKNLDEVTQEMRHWSKLAYYYAMSLDDEQD